MERRDLGVFGWRLRDALRARGPATDTRRAGRLGVLGRMAGGSCLAWGLPRGSRSGVGKPVSGTEGVKGLAVGNPAVVVAVLVPGGP